VGRIGLTHALSPAGGTESEFTVTVLGEDHIYLTCAAAAEERDEDLLRARAAAFDVSVTNVTEAWGVLGLMGPKSCAVLESLTGDDLGTWLSAGEITVAGIPVRALRVSYVGELGWELHVAAAQMRDLFEAIEEAGKPHGLGFFGAYAMNAMRLEKGYPAWGADFTTERTPAETGAGRLIKPEGREFTGKDALLDRMSSPDRWELVLLEIETSDVDPYYAHGVYQGEACVGIVTSAAFGHRTGRTLALAYLRDRTAREGLEVEILGRKRPAIILDVPPYDPENRRMRM
jgi:dimethylglycine dehydrogenase